MLPSLDQALLTESFLAIGVPAEEPTLPGPVPALAVQADTLVDSRTIRIDVTLETTPDDLAQLTLSKIHDTLGRSES